MTDRVEEILQAHINVAYRQLQYIAAGVEFEETADQIRLRLANWEAELDRHRIRQAASSKS